MTGAASGPETHHRRPARPELLTAVRTILAALAVIAVAGCSVRRTDSLPDPLAKLGFPSQPKGTYFKSCSTLPEGVNVATFGTKATVAELDAVYATEAIRPAEPDGQGTRYALPMGDLTVAEGDKERVIAVTLSNRGSCDIRRPVKPFR